MCDDLDALGLRERAAAGRTDDPRRIERVDEHTVVVSPEKPGPYGAAATRISIVHGKVVAMRQYVSREQALAAERSEGNGRPST